jgi:hypothetical protein
MHHFINEKGWILGRHIATNQWTLCYHPRYEMKREKTKQSLLRVELLCLPVVLLSIVLDFISL